MNKFNLYRLLTGTLFLPKETISHIPRNGEYKKVPREFQKRVCSNQCNSKMTSDQATKLVMRLTTEERNHLINALKAIESEEIKAEYQGQLAAFRWRSKFGRPSRIPRLGDVDPTGSFCPLPEDWLLKKYAETIPNPTRAQLFQVALHNAIPFVGFGFLDNSIMIICGDSIELMLGSLITISTMAAAALGNTFSDILGIGSAYYVERAASRLGVKPPNLSPIQLEMPVSKHTANIYVYRVIFGTTMFLHHSSWMHFVDGRSVGVTIGCLLGMFPLLFNHGKDEEKQTAELAV